MRGHEQSSIPLYKSQPPAWLPKAHSAGELGYPGFYPPHSGQEEDILSESNIKNGFVLPPSVQMETFSAQSTVTESLHAQDTISKLEELMNEVFARRLHQIPSIPLSTFRVPSRVTLNDTKRQAWFADLANPDVPLNKLGKSVPHGAKGHDLLDLLHSNNIAIPRAVWFLRVFGANETAGLRNRPSYNPTQYSVEWAGVVTGYMKKQLADIALPSAPRPGMNIKQTFKGVLADTGTRDRWISRFTYCLKLLRAFYKEGLVDRRTFLVWVVHQMGICNLAQAGFIARIADEYLEGMMSSRPLARPFVEACVSKLSEIGTSASREFLVDTECLLKAILQRFCLALPDAFVSPRMWATHSSLLLAILTENIMDQTFDGQNPGEIHQVLIRNVADIQRRNEAMLFYNLPPLASDRLGSSVLDIKLLNSISRTTDINSISFFSDNVLDDPKHKLDMLLTWSITPLQFGDHRPFAAITLIRNWRQRAGERALRREDRSPDEFIQDQLFSWLDSSEVAGDPKNIRAVALLFGKLIQRELFSYGSYIQRLIARGEQGLSFNDAVESRHRLFLRWISLSEPSQLNQRKVTLYGVRARDTPEEGTERQMRKEIRAVMPQLFEGGPESLLKSPDALFRQCKTFVSSPLYEQVRTLKLWLLPILEKSISSISVIDNVLKSYCIAVELMAETKCFRSILSLTLCLLEHASTTDSLNTAIDTLRRFHTLWSCMDVVGSIVISLQTAHQIWKSKGMQTRVLLVLLKELDDNRFLSAQARDQLNAEISYYSMTLQPVIVGHPEPVPNVLPEILLLAGDYEEDAPSTLANALWIKYRMSFDWAWKVWDNTIASLRQIPLMVPDTEGRRGCALRYATFLRHVDHLLPTGLDDHVLGWFLGPGKSEVVNLTADVWDIVTLLLLGLVVHGALKTTTIMTGLVYPAWQCASSSVELPLQQMEVFLAAANNLVQGLLLRGEGSSGIMPPCDLFDVQRLQTRKQDVYCEPHFPALVSNIPVLVSLENIERIPEHLRTELKAIRHSLYEDDNFRQGTFRNLDALREAFEQAMQLKKNTSPEVGDRTMAALRMIFSEAPDEDIEISSWPEKSSFLSPWMISATTIQLQFFLKQMERSINKESHAYDTACMTLDKLTSVIFDHTLSSDEACFVTQMTQGVGSAVAGKIINNGLRFLTGVLRGPSSDTGTSLARAGESFRILIYVAEPLRQESAHLPVLDPDVQDMFFSTLCCKFASIEEATHNPDAMTVDRTDFTQEVVLLARFLQFDLSFEGAWTASTTELSRKLCASLYRLTLLFASGNTFDPIAYPLLLDTLYYLVDEAPTSTKMNAFDPFINYPDITPSDFAQDIPFHYLTQLWSLLPHLPAVSSVADLASCHRDASGKLVQDAPVVNRPWEWIENLGEPSVPEERFREGEDRAKYQVKNSGSISLDTFGARMTGEGIITSKYDDERIEANMRMFEDGLSADNVFKRDWRETRLTVEIEGVALTAGRKAGMSGSQELGPRVASPGASSSRIGKSPARSSLQRSTNSTRSGSVEIIDVDSVSSSTVRKGIKRKAATSDDEVIIVDGPSKGGSSSSNKSKPKPKARKR
ncbi:hypothetical protein IW262DRAFT_1457387 [Armillaria fumosa]|nr:hypothetical protein IW262DRAFT_1457387 [Armillaria fumosa]